MTNLCHQSFQRRAMGNCITQRSVGRIFYSPLRCISLRSGIHLQKFNGKPLNYPSPIPSSFIPEEFANPMLNHALILPKSIEEATHFVDRASHCKKNAQIEFYEHTLNRCTLCNLKLSGSYTVHASAVEHQARLGILERSIALLDTYFTHLLSLKTSSYSSKRFGTNPVESYSALLFTHTLDGNALPNPEYFKDNLDLLKSIDWIELLVQRWWRMLNPKYANGTCSFDFNRIPSLSSSNSRQRLWRLRYLLRLLIRKRILRDSIPNFSNSAFSRSNRFERCEMLGDNFIKAFFYDRLRALFPSVEGGISKRLALIQQMLDSNGGLLALYDYLNIDELMRSVLPNNKSKADVVESVFGELQTFLSADEMRQGVVCYPVPPQNGLCYLTAMVWHVLHELAHAAVMWRVESTLRTSAAVIRVYLEMIWPLPGCPNALRRRILGGEPPSNALEMHLDRPPYATLPLLTPYRRPQRRVSDRGKEAWDYAETVAPTRAGPSHECERLISSVPVLRPTSMQQQYQRGALRVWRAKQQPKDTGVGTNSLLGSPAPYNSTSNKSLGAKWYPLWRQHEERTRFRQAESDAAQKFQLTEEELSSLMSEKAKQLIQLMSTTADLIDLEEGYPDFSHKPQRPNINLLR
ncbi:unnamed protein product [Phytomonas sp. Hart1]|nr:unnamed protein product [Phytomonas sp. Hart1]|eukprot:CCW67053.1 unnamed protein product [Phytomonas sp. isolate Hart1]